MKFKFLLALTLFTTTLCAQSSSIKGKVIDTETGDALPDVSIRIDGSNVVGVTDFAGFFKINNVQPGTYKVICNAGSYESKTIEEVIVIATEPTHIDVTMQRTSTRVDVIKIKRKPKQESTDALIIAQSKSATVSDGISQEQIKLAPARNTGDVIKKVSGASIQDNKFVIIRGLNDRYNAAFINGAPLPSSESDRKAFAFDIFPSNMLDNLVITKTATPDLPAEFAGGIIQITTKNIPDQNFQSFSCSSGYNSITTGKNQVTYSGGKWDWLGIDDGGRAIPSVVPDQANFPINIDKQAELAKKTNLDWALSDQIFSPNFNFQYSLGFSDTVAGKPFGVIMALTYNKTNNYNETIRRGWTNGGDDTIASQIDYDYLDKIYSEQVLAGALANFSLKMNRNNSISFKNIFSINSDDKIISRTGEINPLDNNPSLLKSHAYWFTSNKIYSGQLIGEHYLPKAKVRFNWVGALSDIERKIPNLRRSNYTRLKHFNDPSDPTPLDTMYSASIGSSSVGSNYGGGMFFSENKETISSFKADASYAFTIKERLINTIKIGAFVQNRNREFSARQLGYTKYEKLGGNVDFKDSLLLLNNNEIFANENMGLISPGVGGFKLFDGTRYSDSYTASSSLFSSYIMLDNKFKFARLVWGARWENFTQKLHAVKADKTDLNLVSSKTDVLPSANLILSINKKQNIRVSYSQTLNRPEYRELAPFAFFDFNTQFVVSGNDSLQRALIHNTDFRYEIYPGKGQIISISAFHKRFINPIEQISRPDVPNEISFRNVPLASSYGAEIEFRMILGTILRNDSSRILNSITAFSNLAIIRSAVDVTSILGSEADTRPLQGQSPYVLNSGIQYIDTAFGLSVSLNYNIVAPRIYIVGNINEPSIWEDGRNFIDLQFTKSMWRKKLDVKFNIQNILAERQVFYQNNYNGANGSETFFNTLFTGDAQNKNGYQENQDDLIWSTKFATVYSLSAALKF
jgi:hypothetical protein